MGSSTTTTTTTTTTPPDLLLLPSSSSPSLVLTHPTPAELGRTWTLTHPHWGGALSPAAYLRREAYLMTVPLARRGGITHWILTTTADAAATPPRPVLSSCESIRKGALVATARPHPQVLRGTTHGIASVFTDPALRGRGYARRMMRELGARLRGWQAADDHDHDHDNAALFSVLHSDVGRDFYARLGWRPMEAVHYAFPPAAPVAADEKKEPMDGPSKEELDTSITAVPIRYHDLAELCAVDEQLLAQTLARRAADPAVRPGTHLFALQPELDAMLWHMMREDYMTTHIFGRTASVRGAVVALPPAPAPRRVWAVWARGYYGGLKRAEGNTLHVLRVAVEDEAARPTTPAELAAALGAILAVARAEAAAWHVQDVQLWNPEPAVRAAIAACGVPYAVVERQTESIPSVMWYGQAEGGQGEPELEWVANEKYAWC
ncbi:hypothetical protein P8C59_000989 [Phyllachora maydis]|uniref:N-acetyltransferase domain-containing protein n=1 Tax=Phyllachora maydis TaxID=1825666 RepID=A0AAD9MBT2_9PEZI|nr:hypothetical protein P8C59_000989 [Phyllachora maydis]